MVIVTLGIKVVVAIVSLVLVVGNDFVGFFYLFIVNVDGGSVGSGEFADTTLQVVATDVGFDAIGF